MRDDVRKVQVAFETSIELFAVLITKHGRSIASVSSVAICGLCLPSKNEGTSVSPSCVSESEPSNVDHV